MDVDKLSNPLDYRVVTAGQSLDDATTQTFTYAGVNLKPLSPVYVSASEVSDDWILTWSRRSRYRTSWWTTGVERPLGETTESYEIDVFASPASSTVVRTLKSTSETVTYLDADQVTDLGSPAPASIKFKIYQMSSVVGRGYGTEIIT